MGVQTCELCKKYGVTCWEETGRTWFGGTLPDRSGIVVERVDTPMTQKIAACIEKNGNLSPEQRAKAVKETYEQSPL